MSYAIDQPLLWPCPPNWANPVRETLAWLSDVMQADTGVQQARALRSTPRRGFSFQSLVASDARRMVDAICFDVGAKPVLLPIYPDVQWLESPLAAGATTIPCRTAGFDFVVGGRAVLWLSTNVWEVVVVDAIATDSLTLVDAIASAWPVGTRLYPARMARLQQPSKASYYTSDMMNLQSVFAIDEPCDWPATWPTATTYRGEAVLEWRNEWSDAPTAQYDRDITTIDNGIGSIAYYDSPGRPFRAQSQNFKLQGREDHTAFRSLMYQLQGECGQLWVPSWLDDMRLTAAVSDTGSQLHVPWMGYSQFGYLQANRRDLAIELYDGTRLYRRITGSAEAGDTEVLQLDAALGIAVDPGAVRQIGWLSLCSSAGDTMQIDHITDADGAAESSITWQGLANDV